MPAGPHRHPPGPGGAPTCTPWYPLNAQKPRGIQRRPRQGQCRNGPPIDLSLEEPQGVIFPVLWWSGTVRVGKGLWVKRGKVPREVGHLIAEIRDCCSYTEITLLNPPPPLRLCVIYRIVDRCSRRLLSAKNEQQNYFDFIVGCSRGVYEV